VKSYSLRTVYSVKSLGFECEVTLRGNETRIQFVTERTLPNTVYETTSRHVDGRRELTVGTYDRKHMGSPLLLEIVATCSAPDDEMPLSVRPRLEGQTARALGAATWSWPGVVGPKLGEGLFFQNSDDDTWTWFDAEPIHVGDFYESPERLSVALATTERQVSSLQADQQEAVGAALRWWRHAQEVEYSADRAVAFWVILEVLANAQHPKGSIHQKVTALLNAVFPALQGAADGQRVRKLEQILSDSRCRVVHGGKRDLSEASAMVLVAEHCAEASIAFMLDETTSEPPDAELLTRMGVRAT